MSSLGGASGDADEASKLEGVAHAARLGDAVPCGARGDEGEEVGAGVATYPDAESVGEHLVVSGVETPCFSDLHAKLCELHGAMQALVAGSGGGLSEEQEACLPRATAQEDSKSRVSCPLEGEEEDEDKEDGLEDEAKCGGLHTPLATGSPRLRSWADSCPLEDPGPEEVLPEIQNFFTAVFGDPDVKLCDEDVKFDAPKPAGPLLERLVTFGVLVNAPGGVCGEKVEALEADKDCSFVHRIMDGIYKEFESEDWRREHFVLEMCALLGLLYSPRNVQA